MYDLCGATLVLPLSNINYCLVSCYLIEMLGHTYCVLNVNGIRYLVIPVYEKMYMYIKRENKHR